MVGVYIVQICFAALPLNGAHEFDDYAIQEQQGITPNAGKSSTHVNRVVNRAIRGPQSFVATPRTPQLKSQTVINGRRVCVSRSKCNLRDFNKLILNYRV